MSKKELVILCPICGEDSLERKRKTFYECAGCGAMVPVNMMNKEVDQ